MSGVLEEIPIEQVLPSSNQANQLLSTSVPILGVLIGGSIPKDLQLRMRFDDLLQAWKRDTRYTSSLSKIVMHPSYQAIIGIGPQALPLIFSELEQHGGHWFWALHAITQANPASEGDDYQVATQAWLDWGREHGYL